MVLVKVVVSVGEKEVTVGALVLVVSVTLGKVSV